MNKVFFIHMLLLQTVKLEKQDSVTFLTGITELHFRTPVHVHVTGYQVYKIHSNPTAKGKEESVSVSPLSLKNKHS